ncbi:MAG: ABC transporter ATP-binding protein [Turicibacter sanguinis]|uniref:ABC transporter ATP-binding protein n=1 Tax=Turicibacter TaxID=191303 RepID=UPI0002E35C89|nr:MULTISPECIES: ATP-binding cassette domain-containing protein [Turicibacter]MCU7196843.1 ATP-binding cassette domain-containing protein [Turicibacter sanguinis]MCU7201070.1 ATP-binding cassette domain-containing protein [Turicibacter sanguinis]MDB8558375.1 ATP-binding cassette domain-containing protein [Turicibacter sanguinis]MDB8561065.1 ATP-binding cassette domain-containing protein [Turicibacter sanguinis]MDB8565386.1 ATP-binding cassette domain-containing protein [Turicibacter sanguinis]
MMETVLFVDNLNKKIRRREIIKDVSFTVGKGDICGFIGPNGAGKTTIIRMLTSLVKPTSGQIQLNGYDVVTQRKEALQNLGAIVESPIFFSHMSGEEVLMNLALLIPNKTKSERLAKVLEVLEVVGLSDRKKDKVSTYSLGMKQRLGIAQALLNDPQIIILDEPANGLDPLGMVELRELILKLNTEQGITFFISSHLLDELQKICNKLVIIKSGTIAWQGAKDDFLALGNQDATLEEVFIKLIQ